jgi:hypothetical protein
VDWIKPDGTVLLSSETTASRDTAGATLHAGEDLGALVLLNTVISLPLPGRYEVVLRRTGEGEPLGSRGLLVVAPQDPEHEE